MSQVYCPILSTLGYVLSIDKENVLMINRNKRQSDDHIGKYNGLGGKVRMHEDVLTCLQREIYEEANIKCLKTVLKGTINWTNFGSKGENWFCFIFRIDEYVGSPYSKTDEGTLEWIPLSKLIEMEIPLWEGDRHFLPLVFDDDPRIFHGFMPYDNDMPMRWTYQRV